MTQRTRIYGAVDRERKYQDEKHGHLGVHGHSVAEWLLIAEHELGEAKAAWVCHGGDREALRELLQVVAVGVACLEQHGVIERKQFAYPLEAPESELARAAGRQEGP